VSHPEVITVNLNGRIVLRVEAIGHDMALSVMSLSEANGERITHGQDRGG
jgi:hypothetical protein